MQGCSTLHRRWKGMGRVDLVLVLLVALSPGTTPYISVQVTPGSKPSLPAQEKQDNGNIDAAATPVALLGRSWTGPTCCPSGFVCTVMSNYFSQCRPKAGREIDAIAVDAA